MYQMTQNGNYSNTILKEICLVKSLCILSEIHCAFSIFASFSSLLLEISAI